MSTGVHPHLHFTFMSRARGQGQLHAPNRKWSVGAGALPLSLFVAAWELQQAPGCGLQPTGQPQGHLRVTNGTF